LPSAVPGGKVPSGIRRVKIFLGLFDNGHPCAFNARIMEGDIKAAKLVDRFVDERLDLSGFRDVGFHEQTTTLAPLWRIAK
jgi:hypothetical protein